MYSLLAMTICCPDADKSNTWHSWSSVWGKASCKSTEPSWVEGLPMGICACWGCRSVKTCRSSHIQTLCHTVIILTSDVPLRTVFKLQYHMFTGGSEGECVPQGAVHWALWLRCAGESGGRAQTRGSGGGDTATNRQPEGNLWETRRGDEETGREGECLPHTSEPRVLKWNKTQSCKMKWPWEGCPRLQTLFSGFEWLKTEFKICILLMRRSFYNPVQFPARQRILL